MQGGRRKKSVNIETPEFFTYRVEIHQGLKNEYKEATIDVGNVRRWMKRFRSGDTSLDGKPRSGRPSTANQP
ncbi:hypothetical protein LAZ67_17001518 [Cordylochernes scorpioides]|uniref:Mos1 transposase HTH domain-containing protein n=1 Tax=Cordylochernes scorpioides TaxID=51811 RepID=A0ABY6LDH7_9ARAC|nr:hypothetical protein LAZ67_17001518 [Cordylochernes scorpioides]